MSNVVSLPPRIKVGSFPAAYELAQMLVARASEGLSALPDGLMSGRDPAAVKVVAVVIDACRSAAGGEVVLTPVELRETLLAAWMDWSAYFRARNRTPPPYPLENRYRLAFPQRTVLLRTAEAA